MQIKKVLIENLGPVSKAVIEPTFLDNGKPVPLVLVGRNGAGKSIVLSVLLDAIIESRRRAFAKIPEVNSSDYLRLSRKTYINHNGSYSRAEVSISSPMSSIEFSEVVTNVEYERLRELHPDLAERYSDKRFVETGFLKQTTFGGEAKKDVTKSNFLYFPYFRYERPAWLSRQAEVNFVVEDSLLGHSTVNPVRTSIIEETKRWILNLLLDRELYERVLKPMPFKEGITLNVFFGNFGPSTTLLELIQEVLFEMLRLGDPSITQARLGITQRHSRQVSVIAKRAEGPEFVVAPDLEMLSSGELMTLAMATEIIRCHEIVAGVAPASLDSISGVVLIDEIDLHLHISFQKEVLPSVIRRFSNVQFIVSTHSPLFVLGLKESGAVDVIELPLGNKIEPEEFSEFKQSYSLFVKKNADFRARYEHLKADIARSTTPFVVTEGKTDWQHLKTALQYLKSGGEFTDLELEFFEFGDEVDMGDAKLKQMCETVSKLPQRRAVIFVFDRDNPAIVREMSGEPDEFRDWGNRVYSLCLPRPQHRAGYLNVSIELLYRDEDLRTVDPATNKRLWFSNEIQIIGEPESNERTYVVREIPNSATEFSKKVFDKAADKIVTSSGVPVGLSKSAFVSLIINSALSQDFDRTAFAAVFEAIRRCTAHDWTSVRNGDS